MLQNAEMAFNFGEKPFKFSPPHNFVSVSQAGGDSVVSNSKDTLTAAPAPIKLKANAPQAIIIEVYYTSQYFKICLLLLSKFIFEIFFVSLLGNLLNKHLEKLTTLKSIWMLQ